MITDKEYAEKFKQFTDGKITRKEWVSICAAVLIERFIKIKPPVK